MIKYTRVGMLIHWLTVLGVVMLFALGWLMVDLPQGSDRSAYFSLHKSIGLSVFALLGIRIAWRWRHRPPELPQSLPPWQRACARVVHLGFYVLLLLQPISGYLSSSFSDYKTAWFGVALPHWGWRDPPLNELFTEIHVLSAVTLALLIAIHVAAAIAHVVKGEGELVRRIVPW